MNHWFDLSILLGLSGLLVFTFASRTLPRLALGKRCQHGSDVWFHLIYINAIRNHGRDALRSLPGCMPHSATSVYPFGMHYLLSLLRPAQVVWVERIWGGLIDCLLVWTCVWGSLSFGFDVSTALIAGLLAATSPMYMSANPLRCFEINCRAFGELFFALGAILCILGAGEHPWLYLLGTLSFAVVLLSSKFATQAIALLWLPLCLISLDGWLIASTFIAVFWALAISRGDFARLIVSHLQFLTHYCRKVQWEHAALKNARGGISGFIKLVQKNPTKIPYALFRLVFGNTYGSLAIRGQSFGFVLLCWFLGMLQFPFGISTVYGHLLLSWFLLPLGLFLIINIRGLRFLGEPQRYADYAVLPACWLAASALSDIPEDLRYGIILLLVGLRLPVALASVVAFLVFKAQSFDEPEWQQAVDSLGKYETPRKILAIPIQLGRRITFETYHISDGGSGATTPPAIAANRILFDGNYPFPAHDLLKICKQLDYDTVLIQREIVEFDSELDYDLSTGFAKIMENAKYAVYIVEHQEDKQIDAESSQQVDGYVTEMS